MNWIRAYKLAIKTFIFGLIWFIIGLLFVLAGVLFFFSGLGLLAIIVGLLGLLICATAFLAAVFKVSDNLIRDKIRQMLKTSMVWSMKELEKVPLIPRLLGERKIAKAVEIKVPIELGFKYIANGENAIEWHPDIKEAKRIEGEFGPTSVMKYTAQIGRRKYEFTTRVTQWDPPRKYVDVSKFNTSLIRKYVHEGIFNPTADGFRYIFVLDFKLGPLGLGWLTTRLKAKEIEESLERSLEKLKRVLEKKYAEGKLT
ncbi:MAG: SRPBCC family protein [Archaeoglobaceae archaeon]|nr:SRPBCC family protein [Archaeoglobaceae archaeon]MDW8117815.1 SRPBCC family protein [Archaeoglobaceae archaeon]